MNLIARFIPIPQRTMSRKKMGPTDCKFRGLMWKNLAIPTISINEVVQESRTNQRAQDFSIRVCGSDSSIAFADTFYFQLASVTL
jgi:hypothetical protein